MLLLNTNRKFYMGSPTALSDLTFSDLERSMSRSLGLWVVGHLCVIYMFAGRKLIWMAHKEIVGGTVFCWLSSLSCYSRFTTVLYRYYNRHVHMRCFSDSCNEDSYCISFVLLCTVFHSRSMWVWEMWSLPLKVWWEPSSSHGMENHKVSKSTCISSCFSTVYWT